jgi:hypothetical protein
LREDVLTVASVQEFALNTFPFIFLTESLLATSIDFMANIKQVKTPSLKVRSLTLQKAMQSRAKFSEVTTDEKDSN